MRRRSRGVTLVEVLVALALVGILSAMALVGLQGAMRSGRLSSATRQVWGEMLEAQQRARSRNEPVRLVVASREVKGVMRSVVRWEQLPCDDTWNAAACPRVECVAATCGEGCPCSAVGPEVVLPPNLEAPELDGVCFLAGSGRPVRGRDCLRGQVGDVAAVLNARVALVPLRNRELGKVVSVLRLEPLTGLVSLWDCTAAQLPPGSGCP